MHLGSNFCGIEGYLGFSSARGMNRVSFGIKRIRCNPDLLGVGRNFDRRKVNHNNDRIGCSEHDALCIQIIMDSQISPTVTERIATPFLYLLCTASKGDGVVGQDPG